MTEVNKNIIDAYRSMYEPKEEVLDETNKNDKSDDGEGLDAVQPNAVKKKFKDRKDKDIDNDGDVDSSDEYLHKRRKAVSKAVEKEGSQVVTLLRLSPVFPFAPCNILLGLTSVKASSYILGTTIGLIPSTLPYVYAGSLM